MQKLQSFWSIRSCFEVPKFLSDDLPLFFAIVNDLFPGIEVPLLQPWLRRHLCSAASRSRVEPATCEVPYYDYGSLLASMSGSILGRAPAWQIHGIIWPSPGALQVEIERGLQKQSMQVLIRRSHGAPPSHHGSSWVSILSPGVPSFKETSICPDPGLWSM